jgi:hypothetical protein
LEMKLYMFRTVPLSIIRSYSLYNQHWCMSYRQLSSSRIMMELSSIMILLLLESCLQTCMTYTIAECTVTPDYGQRNCPKHVEFHFQNKFKKLVYLVGFIIRKFVTTHGHINVEKRTDDCFIQLCTP